MSTNLKFITGLSGEAHVKPAMDAQWHSALSGKETFVYDYGQKFSLSVNQAMSTMSIASGIGQIQGRLFIIEESLIETISYPNVPPEVGLTRIDTVLLHWGTSTRIINGETVTINTCEFEYKKNPLANGQPESFAEGDLNLGDTDAYYPMWHVTWNENGIQEVETIFTVVDKATVGIDTTAPSGTIDGDLYSALVDIGWDNDVIDNGTLNQKKLSTKILSDLTLNTFTISNPTMFTNGAGGYYKRGNVVFVNARLYVSGTFSANDYNTVSSTDSFPKPVLQSALNVTFDYANSSSDANAVINEDGGLVVQSGSQALTASTIYITGAYIAS